MTANKIVGTIAVCLGLTFMVMQVIGDITTVQALITEGHIPTISESLDGFWLRFAAGTLEVVIIVLGIKIGRFKWIFGNDGV